MFNILISMLIILFALMPSESMAGQVVEEPCCPELRLNSDQERQVLEYARALLDAGEEGGPVPEFPADLGALKNPVIISLFSTGGELLFSRRLDDESLSFKAKLEECVRAVRGDESFLKKNLKFKAGKSGEPEDIYPDYLHIIIVSYSARLPNFGLKGVFDYKIYEPQVTGIAYEWQGKRVEITPMEALIQNLGPRGTQRELAARFGLTPEDMSVLSDLNMEIYRVIHFGEAYPDRRFVRYHRGLEILTPEAVTYEELLNRLRLAEVWYKNNVREFEVSYEYYPSLDMDIDSDRSMTRSTMAVWVLNRLAFFLDDAELKDLGRKSLDFYLDKYFGMSGALKTGKLDPPSLKLPSGDTIRDKWTCGAFLVAAILERGELDQYQARIDLLMDWMLAYQRDDGIFWTDHGQNQFFQPGHFMLCLARLYEKTRDPRWLDAFNRSFEAYRQALGGLLCLGNDLNAVFAPGWFSQAFAAMYELTGDERCRDMVFRINDRTAGWYALNAEHQAYYDYDGILAPLGGSWGNTSITAASLESLCAAAATARIAGDTGRYQRYAGIIPHGAAYLMRLQYQPANLYCIRNKNRVLGGFRTSLIDNKSWMDNVWHSANAFMSILENRLLDKR